MKEMPKVIKTKNGEKKQILEFNVNHHFIIGVYEGALSKFDMIIKYRQLINEKWTRVRTPKHIHWAVDILIKQNENPEETNKFIEFLLRYWEKIKPIRTKNDRDEILNINKLKKDVDREALKYSKLAGKGEYSIKFLLLLAKLLMYQEKTNNNNAYMFKNLLKELKDSKDIFSIVSIATHR